MLRNFYTEEATLDNDRIHLLHSVFQELSQSRSGTIDGIYASIMMVFPIDEYVIIPRE
jgi:hypothetical protein